MALNFDLSACKDRLGEEAWKASTDHPCDPDRWHPVVEAVVSYSMICGFSRIDENNWETVAKRIMVWEKAFGPRIVVGTKSYPTFEDLGAGTSAIRIKPADIKRLIGFHSNADRMTDKQFANRIAETLFRETVIKADDETSAIDTLNVEMPRAVAESKAQKANA